MILIKAFHLAQGCETVARDLKLVARGKIQILKQALRFLKGIANLPWMGSDCQTRSLTHAAVARETFWLCAFGPAVLHGCTPLI